ncbi:MAG: mechanosensitive ion channel domain-containing protein [Pirellulaceae bacterium]
MWTSTAARRLRNQRPGLLAAMLWVTILTSRSALAQPSSVPAENPPAQANTDALTIELVERRLKEVDSLQGLEDPVRVEIRGLYQEALRDLTAVRELAAQAAVLAEMATKSDENLQRVRSQLSAPPVSVQIDLPADATPAKLEELLNAEEKKLEAAKQLKEKLDLELGRRQSRRAEVPGKIRELQEARAALEAQSKTTPSGADPKTDAILARTTARIAAIDQEIKLAEQELATYTATADLLPLEQDVASREASLADKRVAAWRQAVEDRRAQEVQRQTEAARVEATETPPSLRPLADRSAELAQRSSELLNKIQLVNGELDVAKNLLEKTQQQFKLTSDKVHRVGLNYAIGLLLRKEGVTLPDVRKYRRNSRERERLIRDVQLQIIDLAEERSAVTDVDFVDTFVQDMRSMPPQWTPDRVERTVRGLVDTQAQALTTLQQNLNAYFERLVELESTERQLVLAASEYEKYIDEHVLWIQSSDPLSWKDFRYSVPALQLLGDSVRWREAAWALGRDAVRWLFPSLLVALGWGLLLLVQPRLRQAVTRLGEQAASGSCRRLSVTGTALVLTILIAALWPILILVISWRMSVISEGNDFLKMVGEGFRAAGITYIVLESLRQICRTQGLADAHFNWPQGVPALLRSNLRWLMAVSIPLVFIAALLSADVGEQSQDTLGLQRAEESLSRLCTMMALVAAIVFVQRVLRSDGPLFGSLKLAAPETRLYRFRHVWYGLALAGLASLLTLSVIGYHYTVIRLVSCLVETILLLELLILAMAMVNRWLLIVRRRMAIERAQQRRTTAVQQSDAASSVASLTVEEPTADLATIGEQSRRLLQVLLVLGAVVGLWFIWIHVLPALGFLERFQLWTVTANNQVNHITLNHVIVALVIFLVTILATKNIPGLLELSVLSRLPVDAGTRYAFITICRYIIIIVGLIVAFGWLGVPWANYQWLIAAVTVGLGFGLQEIFANFVSGLIVLFEQPIRVGDIVTIGDVTGVVSKIRMRATTVTNWDRQDFIVPNKEFITGRLLNWTLSNTVNRIVMTVGVTYDSDPDVVRRVLLAVVHNHPHVLSDPEPTVTFSTFGDSSLDFVVHCFLPDLDSRQTTIHELHVAAHRELTAAGVAFAFPTRELHVRSLPPGLRPQ